MEDIAFFWRAQPDIARDFLRILVLLFVGSVVRSIFPLVLICRGGVPPSLVSAIKEWRIWRSSSIRCRSRVTTNTPSGGH